jgi:NADH-quinone oxidoreductase subunit I
MQVKRARKLSLVDRLYLPSILAGLVVTFKHMFRKKDTIQYPEEKHAFGPRYRGVPALVRDQDGREKCVACYMCQWVCPPLAITIEAAEYPKDHPQHAIAASTADSARTPARKRRSSCRRRTWWSATLAIS